MTSINFNISVFENNPQYVINTNYANGTYIISPANNLGKFLDFSYSNDISLFGTLVIWVIRGKPPVLALTLEYKGRDWINADFIIVKPRETQYTFEVTHIREKEYAPDSVVELYTLLLTDQSIGLLNDIVHVDDPREVKKDIHLRLTGNQIVDVDLTFVVSEIKEIVDDYIASGALNNDFSTFYDKYPCKIVKK